MKRFLELVLNIQKYCPANCSSTSVYKTYAGSGSDRFTFKEDLEPYCIEASLAGRTAYTKGRYPNDYSDMPYWFTKEKIIAPYGAGIDNFQAVIEDGKFWRIDLPSDTIPDYGLPNQSAERPWGKFSYPTATRSQCYSIMDATRGEDGYNSRAVRPISATNWFNDSSYSISPTLTIERFYPGSNFYRFRVYKNGVLIDTIVTRGCWNNATPGWGRSIIKPSFILSGFSTDICPSGTCQVDCGTVYCCYGADGIAVSSFSK